MTMDDTFDPLDELLSAYLDDEATPEERARVESDPELLARVASMARVSGVLRDVEIDPAERDATISAALAAFGTQDPADATPDATESARPATSITAAREARARRVDRTRRLVGWLGAAAAVGVAVIALGGTMQGDDEDSASVAADPAARTELEASVAADAAASADTLAGIEVGADAGGAAGAELAAETTAAAATDMATTMALPMFDTDEQLAAYVLDGVAAGTLAPVVAPPTTAGAFERYCTLPGGLDSVHVGAVLYQGQPGELIVAPDLVAPTRAVVLDASCTTILVTVELTEG